MKDECFKNQCEKIINIFYSHNIKLEFATAESLFSAIDEVKKYCFHEEIKNEFNKSHNSLCLEFDVLNKKLLSIGYAYYNSIINICGYPEVPHHLNTIHDIFSFYPAAVIDYFGNFLIMKSADTQEVEKFYYFLDNRVLFDLEENSWDDFLSMFKLPQKTIDFLKIDPDYTTLDYIGFLPNGELNNIGFNTLVDMFLKRTPEKYYSNYIHMGSVVEILQNNFDLNMTVGMQYSTKDEYYLSIEISLSTKQAKYFYEIMYEKNIITETEYKNFNSMDNIDEYKKCVVKLRWQNEQSFSTKYYLEKYVDG